MREGRRGRDEDGEGRVRSRSAAAAAADPTRAAQFRADFCRVERSFGFSRRAPDTKAQALSSSMATQFNRSEISSESLVTPILSRTATRRATDIPLPHTLHVPSLWSRPCHDYRRLDVRVENNRLYQGLSVEHFCGCPKDPLVTPGPGIVGCA